MLIAMSSAVVVAAAVRLAWVYHSGDDWRLSSGIVAFIINVFGTALVGVVSWGVALLVIAIQVSAIGWSVQDGRRRA